MFRRYRHYQANEFYIIFCDTAWGGSDWCAGMFLCKDKLDIPVVYHQHTLASEMTPLIHQEAEKIARVTGVTPVVCFETNNGGTAELERLSRLNRNGLYRIYTQKANIGTTEIVEETTKLGFTTNSATRPKMLSGLKEAIDNRLIRIYDKPTITELFSFVVKQGSASWKAEAETGAHDDLVMALAGAWQLQQTEERPQDFSGYEAPQQVNFMVGG